MNCNIKEQFDSAVNVIQKLPKNGPFQPSQEMSLRFYAFFKQATRGSCKLERPGFWDPVGKAKWDSWSVLGDMTKKDAMKEYTEQLKQVIEAMPHTTCVEEFLRSVGDFYVPVDVDTEDIQEDTPRTRDMIDLIMKISEDDIREGDSGTVSDISGNSDVQENNLQELISDVESEQDEFCDTTDTIDYIDMQRNEVIRASPSIEAESDNEHLTEASGASISSLTPAVNASLKDMSSVGVCPSCEQRITSTNTNNNLISSLLKIQQEMQEMKTIATRIEKQQLNNNALMFTLENMQSFIKDNFPRRNYFMFSMLLNFVLFCLLIRRRR